MTTPSIPYDRRAAPHLPASCGSTAYNQRITLTGLALFGVVSRAEAWEPTFVLAPSPVPWFLVTVLAAVALLLGGAVALLVRRVLVEHRAQLPAGMKQSLQKNYIDTMRDAQVKKAKALEEQMKVLKSRFSMVFMKTRNLTTTLDPEEIFKSIIELLQQEMGCDRFAVLLHDKQRDELYTFRHVGLDVGLVRALTIPIADPCFVTYAFKRRQMIYRGAAEEDPETRSLINRPPLRNTLIALPISTPEQCFGVIHIEGFADNRTIVSEEDLRFLSTLGTFIGIALANANVFLTTKDELTSAKAMSQRQLEEKKRLKDLFGRYAHPSLVEDLISNPGSVRLGGATKQATILFSDIAGFTKFSAKLSPEQIVRTINEYLSAMTEVVLNHNGEIDKFIGDAVMARFGVLADLPDAPLCAVKTALAMFQQLADLQRVWLLQGRGSFTIRIGIATGPVLAGNIGSERRQEFTVMGTTVNLASRLEALNKDLNSQLLIDAATYQAVAQHVSATAHDNVHIRGLDETITVYEIQDILAQQTQQAKIISIKNKLAGQVKGASPAPPNGPTKANAPASDGPDPTATAPRSSPGESPRSR